MVPHTRFIRRFLLNAFVCVSDCFVSEMPTSYLHLIKKKTSCFSTNLLVTVNSPKFILQMMVWKAVIWKDTNAPLTIGQSKRLFRWKKLRSFTWDHDYKMRTGRGRHNKKKNARLKGSGRNGRRLEVQLVLVLVTIQTQRRTMFVL